MRPHDRRVKWGPLRLVRQTHDKCQSDVKAQNVLVVEMTNLSSNSLPPNGDGLIGHHLRSDAQSISLSRINRHPEVWRIAALRSHLADDHRCMSGRECVRLYNYCRARLTVVAACRNCHHVAALHWESNSDTDSIHCIAANSSERSKPATCLATRLRTAFERASGTIRRNSRKPRVRRRSRIAFIRSAVRAIVSLCGVTRYTVTRYVR